MFEIQVDAKAKFKYELQGLLLTTEKFYQSLNLKMSCP